MKPFACAKAYLMVRVREEKTRKVIAPTRKIIFAGSSLRRRPYFNFAFCILNFAFRAQPDKPQFIHQKATAASMRKRRFLL